MDEDCIIVECLECGEVHIIIIVNDIVAVVE